MDLDGVSFTRRGGTLVPSDIHAEEMLQQVKDGREILVSLRKSRNPAFHRFYFALLRVALANWPDDSISDVDTLLDAVKDATGMKVRRVGLDGKVFYVMRSIAFASLDEIRFRGFVDRSAWVLGQRLGVDPQTLLDETDKVEGGFYKERFGRYGR
jgi:hypothetical protein